MTFGISKFVFAGAAPLAYRAGSNTKKPLKSSLLVSRRASSLVVSVATPQQNWPNHHPQLNQLPSTTTTTPYLQPGPSAAWNDELEAMWTMARPINILPSCLLVLVGAWAAVGGIALSSIKVWVMGIVSSAIAAASCLINDYFDSAVDSVNAPMKPLPSGRVSPEHALLLAGGSYILILMAACFFTSMQLRLIIAASAATTLLYTPVLKRISFVKNAAVAATIAGAPLAGALAAGASAAHLRAALGPCGFLFLAVCYREILMDIHDVEGDAAAGVVTLPVLLGRKYAMGLGLGLLVACVGLIVNVAWHGNGLAWVWQAVPELEIWVRAMGAGAGCAALLRPIAAGIGLMQREFPEEELGTAIDDTLKTVGTGLVLLAAMTG